MWIGVDVVVVSVVYEDLTSSVVFRFNSNLVDIFLTPLNILSHVSFDACP